MLFGASTISQDHITSPSTQKGPILKRSCMDTPLKVDIFMPYGKLLYIVL